MSGPFGAGAARLAGLAGQVLGWRPGEFWAATPAELAQILAPLTAARCAPLSRAECDALMEQER